MARIRTVKPALFRHRTLFNLEKETGLPIRIAWVGLFTVADREGRFKWDADEIKLDVLPWDDLDFGKVLLALESAGLVQRYQVDGEFYGQITKWKLHQVINHREAESTIPGIERAIPEDVPGVPGQTEASTGGRERKGRERKDAKPFRPNTANAGSDLPISPKDLNHLKEILGPDYLTDLGNIYQDDAYLKTELGAAYLYFRDKPRKNRKTPQGWRATVSGWMKRGWDSYINRKPAKTGTDGEVLRV